MDVNCLNVVAKLKCWWVTILARKWRPEAERWVFKSHVASSSWCVFWIIAIDDVDDALNSTQIKKWGNSTVQMLCPSAVCDNATWLVIGYFGPKVLCEIDKWLRGRKRCYANALLWRVKILSYLRGSASVLTTPTWGDSSRWRSQRLGSYTALSTYAWSF